MVCYIFCRMLAGKNNAVRAFLLQFWQKYAILSYKKYPYLLQRTEKRLLVTGYDRKDIFCMSQTWMYQTKQQPSNRK